MTQSDYLLISRGQWDETASPQDVQAAIDRFYSWYSAFAPTSDAVMYPSRSLEIRTDGVFRESEDGESYGAMQDVEGDLPRIPWAAFLRASRA